MGSRGPEGRKGVPSRCRVRGGGSGSPSSPGSGDIKENDDKEARKDSSGDPTEGRDEAAQRDGRLRGRGGPGTRRAGRPALRGAPVRAADAEHGTAIEPGFDGGTQLGKRYADDELGLELLCTKAGEGSISVGETVLAVKGAKPLPASD